MKKEILRINNLNYNYASNRRLENISMCILAGESVGFLGLTYSGKDLLVQILCGNLGDHTLLRKAHPPQGHILRGCPGGYDFVYNIYIDGMKIETSVQLAKCVYRLAASNYMIDDWTVAEYIGLMDSSWLQMLWKRKILEEEVGAYFQKLGLTMDVSRKMKNLTELEKRTVDVVKACRQNANVLIIEDEFEGMRLESIKEFAKICKRLIKDRMALIVNSHSDVVLSILSDKYIIFKKGRIVKKCRKDYIKDSAHLEVFLLGNTIKSKKKTMDSYEFEQNEEKGVVYRIRNLELPGGKKGDFNFLKGQAVTFLVLDSKEKERIFLILSGRQAGSDTYCILNEICYDPIDFKRIAEEKVVSVMHMGSQEEVFAGMPVGENLLLPSLRKISSLEYITSSGKMSRMLKRRLDGIVNTPDTAAENLEINDLIGMTMERWYIYNPKVLVLFEPFAQCDIYGVSIVKSYIKKFVNRGTAVIIIKSRSEYVEDISDQMISLD